MLPVSVVVHPRHTGAAVARQQPSFDAVVLARDGRRIFDESDWHELGQRLKLAPRELQVLKGVFDDDKELAIAYDLGISQHTVHTYLERIYRKLSVASRVSLVVRVMAEHLHRRRPVEEVRP
jgi:DNA-binding NarL/FixJ family response regulator